jgi:pilus assembly protein CpaF
LAISDRFSKQTVGKLKSYEKYVSDEKIEDVPSDVSETFDENELIEKMSADVMLKVQKIPVWFEYDKDKQRELIENFFDTSLVAEYALENISEDEKILIIDSLFNQVSGFGVLQKYLEKENVDSIIVNGISSIQFVSGGKILESSDSLTHIELEFLIRNIKNSANMNNSDSSVVYANMNGCFVSIINKPVSVTEPIILIKKIKDIWNLETLIEKGLLTKEIAEFLISALKMGDNIILSGDISSGKTTFIDSILSSVFYQSRVAVFEDISQTVTSAPKLMKISLSELATSYEFENILSVISSTMPEYLFFDSKNLKLTSKFIDTLTYKDSAVITVSASDCDSAIAKLENALILNSNYSEKFAKRKILNDFNYLVQFFKDENGICRIEYVLQLEITKNFASSIKEIYHYSPKSIQKEEAQDEDFSSIKSRFKNS